MTTWLGIDSSHLSECCANKILLEGALNGTDTWDHNTTEIHWFILDLKHSYAITKFRGRSNSTLDPIDVDIYVSDETDKWGTAVVTGISTWQDVASWQEVTPTEKCGRYVKVVINTTEGTRLGHNDKYISWGDPLFFSIFDVGYDISPPLDPVGTGWEMLSIKGVSTVTLANLQILYNDTYYTWTEATTTDNEENEPLILPWVYGWDWEYQYYLSATSVTPALGYWFYWYHHGALYVVIPEASSDASVLCIPGTQINVS